MVGAAESEALAEDELTTLALAADPDMKLADDALCVWDVIGLEGGTGVGHGLPHWYMPSPMTGARPRRRPWHRRVALLVIVSFLVIEALGLCVTYGQLVVA